MIYHYRSILIAELRAEGIADPLAHLSGPSTSSRPRWAW